MERQLNADLRGQQLVDQERISSWPRIDTDEQERILKGMSNRWDLEQHRGGCSPANES